MNRYFINVITNPSFHYEDNQNLSYFLKKRALFFKIFPSNTWRRTPLPLLHGDKSVFDPVQSVVHNGSTSGCHYCSSFLKGDWSTWCVFLVSFFFFFFFKGLPLLLSCKYQRESPAQRHISGRDGFSPDLAPVQACVSEQWGRQWLVVSSTTKQQNH